jgi:hypothetical protein
LLKIIATQPTHDGYSSLAASETRPYYSNKMSTRFTENFNACRIAIALKSRKQPEGSLILLPLVELVEGLWSKASCEPTTVAESLASLKSLE